METSPDAKQLWLKQNQIHKTVHGLIREILLLEETNEEETNQERKGLTSNPLPQHNMLKKERKQLLEHTLYNNLTNQEMI